MILPSLSARHAEQDQAKFRSMIDWAAKVIVLVGLPASIALFMLSTPIIQALRSNAVSLIYAIHK